MASHVWPFISIALLKTIIINKTLTEHSPECGGENGDCDIPVTRRWCPARPASWPEPWLRLLQSRDVGAQRHSMS